MRNLTGHSIVRVCVGISLLLISGVVFAHTEDAGTGFMAGFLHPVFGLDHLLAMISVGIVSAQMGGRNIWIVPSVFVLAMISGGILGIYQVGLPLIEVGIALSVIILGAAIVIADRKDNWMIMVFVAFFGIFHGHAHGMEMPGSASPAFYAFGFIASTSLIHVTGVLIGHFATKAARYDQWLRYSGAMLGGMGVHILIGLLSTS